MKRKRKVVMGGAHPQSQQLAYWAAERSQACSPKRSVPVPGVFPNEDRAALPIPNSVVNQRQWMMKYPSPDARGSKGGRLEVGKLMVRCNIFVILPLFVHVTNSMDFAW
jgi:hypothetical protein